MRKQTQVPISDEAFIALVKESTTVREVIIRCGLPYTGSGYNSFKRTINRLGIDTSHFIFKRRSYTNAQLSEAVKNSSNETELVQNLGLVLGGASRKNIRQHIKQLGLDASHLKRPDPINKIPLDKILVKNSTYKSWAGLKHRLIQELGWKKECHQCGTTHWRGQPVPLELDHKNGDRTDNSIHNLWFLCAMCHRLTPTWGGKKKTYLKRQQELCCPCDESPGDLILGGQLS